MEVPLTVPDDVVADLVDMYCKEGNYNPEEDGNRNAFALGTLRKQIGRKLTDYRKGLYSDIENAYVKGLQDAWEAENPEPGEVYIG